MWRTIPAVSREGRKGCEEEEMSIPYLARLNGFSQILSPGVIMFAVFDDATFPGALHYNTAKPIGRPAVCFARPFILY